MSLKSSNKVDVNRLELEIEISSEEFNKEVDKVYGREKNKIIIPGFRKGKAPRNFIEKYYGEKVFYEDAINALYPDAIESAAKEANVELVDDHIDFDVVVMSKDKGLIFKVKVTVMPEVSVENYKGIEVSKKEVKPVTDEDVNLEIQTVREKYSRLITVDDAAAEMGNVVDIDFEGFSDGVAFEGGKAEHASLELGAKQFIEGFEGQVVGHKAGEEFEINVTFPEQYHAENLAGKLAVFKVKLHRTQKKELPEIDDEFVKDISEFDTLEEFKADIKSKLLEGREAKAKAEEENELIDNFVKLVKAEIPEAMIKNKTKDFIRDLEYRLQPQGMKIQNYMKFTGQTPESLEEQFRPQAENHVKLDLGLKKVAQIENLVASDDEVEAEYNKIAESYKMEANKIKQFVPKDDVTKDIIFKKAMEFIKENKVGKK